MNELQIFDFKGQKVRTTVLNGEPWFVGKDVAEILGYTNPSKALIDHVDAEDKLNNESLLSLGQRGGWLISESGLYSLVLSSQLPKAKEFKRWVTHEVIPTIRAHGAYMTPEAIEKTLTNPDFIISLATELKQERAQRLALEAQAALDRPKTIFADAVSESKTCILIGVLAKLLKQNGVNIGQNRLFAWMRNHGWLIKSGEGKNTPTQKAMEMKLFEVKEGTHIAPDGHSIITRTTKVTGKGQQFFINAFLGQSKKKSA